jgi:predicted nucleotidyltransferase
MPLFEALARILSRLDGHGAGAALLGGLAVSVWTEPRFTRDIDLAVAVRTDVDAERLVRNLSEAGYRVLATVEQKAAARLATARLLPPGESAEGLVVDLLFASSGIEPEIVSATTEIDIGAGVPVPVARIGHLIALKLLAYDEGTRPQDALDLRALKTVLDAAEKRRAEDACELIVRRGYHRGRDLQTLLDAFLSAAATP